MIKIVEFRGFSNKISFPYNRLFFLFFGIERGKNLEHNVWSRFFIYSLVFVKLTLKQSKYIEIRIFGFKIILNLNILRTVNDKPNLKKDLNSASKNEHVKLY